MRISVGTLRALSRELADQYPYAVQTIFKVASKIAKENGYELITELEKPLANRLNEMMAEGN